MDDDGCVTGPGRTSPPDPFAVRHTRPWRRRRLRRPKATFFRRIDLAIPWILWPSALAMSTGAMLGGGLYFYVFFPIHLFMLAVNLFLFHGVVRELIVGRCPRCNAGLANSGDFSFRRPRWCPKCSFLIRPEDFDEMLERWAKDRQMVSLIQESDPSTKWLSMSLLIAMMDRADELVIEPGQGDYRSFFLKDEMIAEEEPPTPHMHRPIVTAARAIWKSNPYDDRPFESTQQVIFGKHAAGVTLTVTPTPAGEILRFHFSYADDISAESPIPQPAAMV